jgi:hypothetical protein
MVVDVGIVLMPVDVITSTKNSLESYWNHSTTMALTSSTGPSLWPYHALKWPDTWSHMVIGPNCMGIPQHLPAYGAKQSWTVWHQNGYCHDDTHSEHAGMLSHFVNREILQGVTIVLCIEDNVRVLKHQLVYVWMDLHLEHWHLMMSHTVPICFNMPFLLVGTWLTTGVSCAATWSPMTGRIC